MSDTHSTPLDAFRSFVAAEPPTFAERVEALCFLHDAESQTSAVQASCKVLVAPGFLSDERLRVRFFMRCNFCGHEREYEPNDEVTLCCERAFEVAKAGEVPFDDLWVLTMREPADE